MKRAVAVRYGSAMVLPLLSRVLCCLSLLVGVSAQSEPAAAPRLRTAFCADVDPRAPHPEYPRPQLVRERWANLNGEWQLAVQAHDAPAPATYPRRVLVPFPLESTLSGVTKGLLPSERAWYRRTFSVPATWRSERTWLRFGAVDWEARVLVNGQEIGTHRGGYDPFNLDITDALRPQGEQELIVVVHDPTDQGTQPRGKQVLSPSGIWYTPTSGIWQTVWLEPVPALGIERLHLVPKLGPPRIEVRAYGHLDELDLEVEIGAPASAKVRARGDATRTLTIAIPDAQLWSPDQPNLYAMQVRVRSGDDVVDVVASYFGLREIALGKDAAGTPRLLLNGTPLFQLGTLDQGFWPDGLYTAPTDAALRFDLEVTKRLGFNMVRKHVKVEPATWYAHCDRLGLLVWQDMPSGDQYIGSNDADAKRSADSAAQFEFELGAMMDAVGNSPAVVMWVPFNEGWGQFDTARIAQWVKARDPTRLVNSASGWTDRGVGDVHDVHVYPGPGMPKVESTRAAVLGEFGGLGLPVAGHTWQQKENWGYRSFTDSDALQLAYAELLTDLRLLIPQGLCAAVYTQTTDVEIEVNGLLTYDRALVKVDEGVVRAANLALHLPPPRIDVLVPCAQESAQRWRFTTDAPADGWEREAFDDAAWQESVSGFGTAGTPGAIVGTEWKTRDLWLRRTIELPVDFDAATLHLRMHHDEDVAVHVNGVEIARVPGYSTAYRLHRLPASAAAAFRKGANVLAVHCRQTTGGQYIDVGVVAVRER